MAFRGREWYPADSKQVEGFIRDRLSLTELNPDVLKPILEQAIFDRRAEARDDVDELYGDAVDITRLNSEKLRAVNRNYYTAMRAMVPSVSEKEKVNIVLPVYNSIHLVKECIQKVLACTFWPYHLTIVDDASDKKTHDDLVVFANSFPDKITLLTNRKNRGFSATVNRGIKHREREYAYTCLLNSDVLVTPYWLSKMVAALKANPRNKIVNPVTNNTAVINVGMHAGFTYQNMNTLLELTTGRHYPEIMPTGFCFLFPNSLISAVGYLDESYQNFGEETDFWMRTISYSNGHTFDQWRAVLADDTYIFHQRGASYESLGDEQHMNFRKTASAKFRAAWPSWTLWNKSIDINQAVGPLRKYAATKDTLDSVLKENRVSKTPICFVTHSVEACGGMHYIADIVNSINEAGGDARVALVARQNAKVGDAVAELRCGNYVFKDTDDFILNFKNKVFSNGIVIAATSELAPIVAVVCDNNPTLTAVLHAQSYEPALTNSREESNLLRDNFFKLPTIISNSRWITKELDGANVLATIHPGVDRDLFYRSKPRESGDERPTVLLSLNGSYPFKGSQRGVQVAQALHNLSISSGLDIRILAYGVDNIQGMPPTVICKGRMARSAIAQLLSSEVDVFIDPSTNHSYGMPALEAIACGVPVVGWDNRGIREYLQETNPQTDPIRPNDSSVQDIAKLIFQVLCTPKVGSIIAQWQAEQISGHDRQKSVQLFQEALAKLRPQSDRKLKICLVTPHLRKHGGPTTILTLGNQLAARGHEVTFATVYSDLNPGVIKYTDLPIILLNQTIANIPECDVLISNSDNPLNAQFVENCPQAKKKVMLKLSHNPRFKELEELGLRQKWDAIVTSSQWLATVCEQPGDWKFEPKPATRIGWYHYNFDLMRRNLKRKKWNDINQGETITISTLIHHHPMKGANEAGTIFETLRREFGDSIQLVGVGEINPKDVHIKVPGVRYVHAPTRTEMADLMFKTDIWLSCSKSEGLGRMALEAMTGGAACVLTDTGAEFVVDGQNALVTHIGDTNSAIQYTHQLIKDIELRRKIALAGFVTAKNLSDPSDMVNKFEEVLFGLF